MSKHWNPSPTTGAAKPSRIRREPVLKLVVDERQVRKAEYQSRERQMWGGVAGITLLAVALAVAAVGISWATLFYHDPRADAQDRQFGQCYNGGQNCVFDADTIRVEGEKLEIAGMMAPRIQDAQCEDERNRGIDAAMRLASLLNSGEVTVGKPFTDQVGRTVRSVQVNGQDVAKTMIAAEAAREPSADKPDYCG